MAEPFSADPAVMHGRLCVAGTRVTVQAVEGLLELGLSDDDVAKELPLTPEQVRAVRLRQLPLR